MPGAISLDNHKLVELHLLTDNHHTAFGLLLLRAFMGRGISPLAGFEQAILDYGFSILIAFHSLGQPFRSNENQAVNRRMKRRQLGCSFVPHRYLCQVRFFLTSALPSSLTEKT